MLSDMMPEATQLTGGGQRFRPGHCRALPPVRAVFRGPSPRSSQNGVCVSITDSVSLYAGALLWKIEQKSNRAFACGKVTIKGKRHWYEALPQAVFVALSDDTAWVIRTNGDLYLQTGNEAARSGAGGAGVTASSCTLLC